MPLLTNEFDVRSVLHGQVSLAAVNQTCVLHEAMNRCKKKSKDSLKDFFKNVNIKTYICGTAANSVKPDQTPQNAASDQVLYYLQTEVSFTS